MSGSGTLATWVLGQEEPYTTGPLAATEGADTAAFTGVITFPVITGTFALTEDRDGAGFFSAGFIYTDRLAAYEATDKAPTADSTLYTADDTTVTADAFNEGDTAVFAGALRWDAVFAATEVANTAAFAGTVVGVPAILVRPRALTLRPSLVWPRRSASWRHRKAAISLRLPGRWSPPLHGHAGLPRAPKILRPLPAG
jgi:hypothetical protein